MSGIGEKNQAAIFEAIRDIAGLVENDCNVSIDQRKYLLSGVEFALQKARREASQSLDWTLECSIDIVRKHKARLSEPGHLRPAEGFRVGLVL